MTSSEHGNLGLPPVTRFVRRRCSDHGRPGSWKRWKRCLIDGGQRKRAGFARDDRHHRLPARRWELLSIVAARRLDLVATWRLNLLPTRCLDVLPARSLHIVVPAAPCRRGGGEHSSQDRQSYRSCEGHVLTPLFATSLLLILEMSARDISFHRAGLTVESCDGDRVSATVFEASGADGRTGPRRRRHCP